ncbi:MAG: universal stress protein [Gelidibacter sp.]|uniref:universal stress protein n=1 Tax=Gelidibacter sp. TaxID=2018083 RepID=UPI0032672EDB
MISILLPTDFSENSKNAITYATEFFKHQTVAFFFMHAYYNEAHSYDEMVSRGVFYEIVDSVRNRSERNLENMVAEIKKSTPNPRHTYQVISSYKTLVEAANLISEAKNIDLIVMGTTGKSNQRRLKFGSNTFQVLKSVKCPVLAIPSHYKMTELKNILFPTDYRVLYKERELKLLNTLAESYRSLITVLHISKNKKLTVKQGENQAFINNTVKSTEVDFCIENNKDIALSIQEYIKNKEIELLVMVNTRHSFWEKILLESTIDHIGIDLKIPLLVLQNATRSLK